MQTRSLKKSPFLVGIGGGIALGVFIWFVGGTASSTTVVTSVHASTTFLEAPLFQQAISTSNSQSSRPFALATNAGDLFVSYVQSDRIDQFSPELELVRTVRLNVDGASITGIFVEDGRLYAADFHRGELAVIDLATTHVVTTIGYLPDQRTQLKLFGVTSYSGNLYVTDSGTNRILAISATAIPGIRDEWELLLSFPSPRGTENGLSFPTFCAVTPDGRLLVSDVGSRQVKAFTCNGRPAHVLDQRKEASFSVPMGIAFDNLPSPQLQAIADTSFIPSGVHQQGRIHVVDSKQTCVKVFDSFGNYLLTYGKELREPNGVAIDTLQKRIFVADAALSAIMMYRY